jgi:hypothetical protein
MLIGVVALGPPESLLDRCDLVAAGDLECGGHAAALDACNRAVAWPPHSRSTRSQSATGRIACPPN